jgi:hypothetical protein
MMPFELLFFSSEKNMKQLAPVFSVFIPILILEAFEISPITFSSSCHALSKSSTPLIGPSSLRTISKSLVLSSWFYFF